MADAQTKPRLSLCLATFNRARYLDRYLTHHLSILDASGIDYELVISDNCSTDETPEILARYASRHPQIRVSRQGRNVGAYPNILETLRQARGEVVVSIADDDLMIAAPFLANVQRMIDEPDLVMIQAPWFLVDETRGGAITGQFYHLEAEQRFGRGQFASCLGFILQNDLFPECWIIRGSALARINGPNPRFAYSFFALLANALLQGEVLFCPEPYLLVTSVSEGDNVHVGNGEAMEAWDVYRGGLEMLASYARQFNPGVLPDAGSLGDAIQAVVFQRMSVAAKLQVHGKNWSNAYEILRRLHAYEVSPDIGMDRAYLTRMAAVEVTLLELAQRGATEIVISDNISDEVLAGFKPIEGVRMIRAEALGPENRRRGYCLLNEPEPPSMRPQDISCDVVATMARFPVFETSVT